MNAKPNTKRGGKMSGGAKPIRDGPSRSWFVLPHANSCDPDPVLRFPARRVNRSWCDVGDPYPFQGFVRDDHNTRSSLRSLRALILRALGALLRRQDNSGSAQEP